MMEMSIGHAAIYGDDDDDDDDRDDHDVDDSNDGYDYYDVAWMKMMKAISTFVSASPTRDSATSISPSTTTSISSPLETSTALSTTLKNDDELEEAMMMMIITWICGTLSVTVFGHRFRHRRGHPGCSFFDYYYYH